ncbi:hypothetical protein ARTHROSP310_35290 [Arthrobacter sp. AD-310]
MRAFWASGKVFPATSGTAWAVRVAVAVAEADALDGAVSVDPSLQAVRLVISVAATRAEMKCFMSPNSLVVGVAITFPVVPGKFITKL